jgi:hypothetical protein
MESVWNYVDLDTYLQSIVNEDNIEEQLVQESRWKISYRESQLHRRGLLQLHAQAMELEAKSLDWDELGVSDQAVESLQANGVSPNQLHRYFAHPKILKQTRLLHYYRILAGVSENRLRGMDSIKPALKELDSSNQSTRTTDSLRRLCRFFNSLISTWASSLTDDARPEQRALISALLTEGAAIEGSSRNAGGRKAVVNVASVLVEEFDDYNILASLVVKQTSKDSFITVSSSDLGDTYVLGDLSGAYDVREVRATNGGYVNVDQTEPDMVVHSPSGLTGYGEIKDRKDISNQWEGWLPLIRSKLEDFESKKPDAKRMILQPVYTRRMIEGERGSSAEDVGVKGLIEGGLLDVPFNISQTIADEESRDFFGAYIRQLIGYDVESFDPKTTR